jgi:hypothetical protein
VLKRQAETPGITAEQRSVLSKQADGIRSRLSSMGVDITNLGANVNSSKANAAAGVQTLASKNQEFNQDVTIAELTGTMPNGAKTTAEQQRQLQNEWLVADQTGKITPTLAKMYNIPAGTPTRAAMEFARQLAISQQNANTSAFSASNSANNAAFNKLMDVWAATGVAPSGLQGYGIQPGAAYKPNNSSEKQVPYDQDPDWSAEISEINADPEGQYEWLLKNSSSYIQRYTYDGYQKLLSQAKSQID